MIPLPFTASAAERRLLTDSRLSGPMPWIVAIMMFLTVLAAAGGLALGHAASGVTSAIAQRITVQVVEANPDVREAQAEAVVELLRRLPGVTRVERISDEEIDQLLEPWIGAAGSEEGIPVPALIDADLTPETHARLATVERAVTRVAPSARIDDHARFLAPLAGLISSLTLLALVLVLLAAGAMAAAVILAIRAALNTHRGTIEVLHLMGATDVQVARLFQRRIALDTFIGGVIGFLAAIIVLLILGQRIGAVGSELLGEVTLPWTAWALLALLPVAGALIATLVARISVLASLKRML